MSQDLVSLFESGLKGLNIKIGGTLPGEQVLAAYFYYAAAVRETMSQANRDRQDALANEISEDVYYVWREIWVAAGVLPKKGE